MSLTPLAITELTPCTGLEDGGVYVDVFGTGFDELTTVTFGNQAATRVIYYSNSKLVGVTRALAPPAVAPATLDVTVTNGAVSYTSPAAVPAHSRLTVATNGCPPPSGWRRPAAVCASPPPAE